MTARRKQKNTLGRHYPILFSEQMVNSAFDGTRTQIRKNIAFNNGFESPLPFMWDDQDMIMNTISNGESFALQRRPGDSSWWWVAGRTVSKYVAATAQYGGPGSVLYVKEKWTDVGPRSNEHIMYYSGPNNELANEPGIDWKISTAMKKEHARLWLRITDMRAERLCAITTKDVKRSGFNNLEEFKQHWHDTYFRSCLWEDDPFVWVIDFTIDRMTKR